MPLVPRFGIYHMLVSREFAREWQFNGLATTRPSDFPEQDFWTFWRKYFADLLLLRGTYDMAIHIRYSS